MIFGQCYRRGDADRAAAVRFSWFTDLGAWIILFAICIAFAWPWSLLAMPVGAALMWFAPSEGDD